MLIKYTTYAMNRHEHVTLAKLSRHTTFSVYPSLTNSRWALQSYVSHATYFCLTLCNIFVCVKGILNMHMLTHTHTHTHTHTQHNFLSCLCNGEESMSCVCRTCNANWSTITATQSLPSPHSCTITLKVFNLH